MWPAGAVLVLVSCTVVGVWVACSMDRKHNAIWQEYERQYAAERATERARVEALVQEQLVLQLAGTLYEAFSARPTIFASRTHHVC